MSALAPKSREISGALRSSLQQSFGLELDVTEGLCSQCYMTMLSHPDVIDDTKKLQPSPDSHL